MELRSYRPEDLQEIAELFYLTIRHVNIKDYSEEQVKVWSERREALLKNADFFMRLHTVVACETGKIIGYGNIDRTGYLDHLYVHKDFQGRHIASEICEYLESYAFERGVKQITVHASLTALPFFQKRGYEVLKEQQVILKGIKLKNFLMKKDI